MSKSDLSGLSYDILRKTTYFSLMTTKDLVMNHPLNKACLKELYIFLTQTDKQEILQKMLNGSFCNISFFSEHKEMINMINSMPLETKKNKKMLADLEMWKENNSEDPYLYRLKNL